VEIPAAKILDRDLSLSISKEMRAIGAPLLREVIDEGIRVFERCSVTARGADENAGLLFPYLHLFELLDSLEVALDGAAAGAVLLRASFEALLTVEWVASEPSLRYGAAYVVVDLHRRIRGWERFVQGHDRQKTLKATFEKDRFGQHITLPVEQDAEKRIVGLRSLLAKPHLQEAEAEYQRLKNPPFYALWGGPRNLEQLALRLNRGGQYEFLYRLWSATAHSEDLQRQLGSRDGSAAVRPFRNGESLKEGYNFGVGFGLEAMRCLLRHYRPTELDAWFSPWYNRSISERYLALSR
jgi:hypothetical protein